MAITLLLVEDDDFVRPALTRALTRTGVFTVVPAEHGEQALEIFDTQQVDAILSDLQMPVMDGLTLLSHLLERGSRVPIAVMTGQPITPDLAARLHGFGIAATFSKPIEIATLADDLQRAMSPATVGRITGITLFGFLQLIEVERKSALIVVRGAGQEGRLYFDHGNLIHAHTRRLQGIAAVNDIVAWPDPKLEIFYKRKSRERTIKEPLQHILMEAARLLDERGAAGEQATEEGADATRPDVQEALDAALEIDGVLGVALIDSASGLSLGTAAGSGRVNVELAGAGAAELLRAEALALAAAGVKDTIEDVMVTLGKQYHLIRFLGPDSHAFLYIVLDRDRSNLGMARNRLAAIGRRIVL